MPFRLVRFCLKICFSFVLVALFVAEANAAMTVTSTRRGITGGAHTFYYTTDLVAGANFFDTYDPNYLSPNELGTVNDQVLSINDTATRSHILNFNVATDVSLPALPSGQVYVLAFQYKETVNRLIPITQVNGINCTTSGAACADYNLTQVGGYNYTAGGANVVGPYWFGAVFTPGSFINVGIYASEICNFYALQGGTTLGGTNPCVGSGLTALPNSIATQPAVLPLKARIYAMPITAGTAYSTTGASGAALASVDTTFAAKDSLDIYLHFQEEAGTTGCPSPSTGVYIPGDSLISVDTSRFSYGATTANHAAGNILLGLGNGGVGGGAAPSVISPGYQDNPVVGRLSFSGSQPLGGFINSPVGTDYLYDVEFLVRDYGGLVVRSATPAQCTYSDVQVTSILGFLNRSSCFIATAAFRSGEDAPVMMLREFRDRVLLKTHFGEKFVHWYYSWSPTAAEWLMEHPVFRVPALSLLIPLQFIAWLGLHPFILGFLLLISLGVLSIPFFPGVRIEE